MICTAETKPLKVLKVIRADGSTVLVYHTKHWLITQPVPGESVEIIDTVHAESVAAVRKLVPLGTR
jgi:hypothetical protein